MVSEKKCFSYLKTMRIIGKIYVSDYNTLLHTKYLSSAPHGFKVVITETSPCEKHPRFAPNI